MAPIFTPYPPVPSLRSQLLTNPPVAVPPIDDLISLQEELKNLRNKSLARHKKAQDDLKILEGLHRKFKDKDKEREKGKLKDKVKIKREATATPDPLVPSGPSSTPSSAPSGGYGVKALLGAKAAQPNILPPKPLTGIKKYSPATPGSGSTTTKDKIKKEKERVAIVEKDKKKDSKKKKRKRENGDSDVEEQPERVKKVKRSPDPAANNQHKQKGSTKQNHAASGFNVPHTPTASFALPRHTPHIPQRPIPAPLPTPGPSNPQQVMDDFSKLKPPPQTAVSTFWSHLEPWLRPIREEDVGLLEWDGDEETPFVIPPLGRHYTEIWDDEDNDRYPLPAGPSQPTPTTASLPKWDPSTLQDADLISHDKGHTLGPVHERLLCAMLPAPVLADGKPAAPGGNIKSTGNGESKMISPTLVDERIGKLKPFEGDKQPPKVNVQDMQERLMKELRSIGLLGEEEPDYTKSADDPLAAELRQCQRELRKQMAVNKARRNRLCEIAKSRLARNEFEEHAGALERSILSKYNLLQRRDMPKQAKKKKKSGGAGGGAHVVPDGPFLPPPHIHPAAWGLERGEDTMMNVDEELDGMIVTRQRFVDMIQPCLDAKQRDRPGLLYGSPAQSIFRGIGVSETKVKGG